MNAKELGAETRADTRMTFAAGFGQALRIDCRERIACRQNVVHAVAGRAIGGGKIATLQGQAMKALDVGRKHIWWQPVLRDDPLRRVTLAAGLRNVGRRNPGCGEFDSLDGMLAVTIGADRRIANSGRDGLAVNAARISLPHVIVAFPAGCGDGLPVQFRFGIRRAMQIMRPVAIRADRRIGDAVGVGQTMHALVVGNDDRALAQLELLHFLDVPMAAAAGLWNVRAIHRGSGIAIIEQLMRAAVAILA